MTLHDTQQRIAFLEAELAAELRGAQFLARQVELAWTEGLEEGRRRGILEVVVKQAIDSERFKCQRGG